MPNTPQRALIIIDVQNEYVTGNLPIEFPDISLSLANIGKAMDAAHAANVAVIVVQNHAPPEAPAFAKGSPGWELHEIVRTRPNDHYMEKTMPSAFTGTDLTKWLADHNIDTLTVAGYMTHNCDDSTIKHALHAGLDVEFLFDAAGAVSYANRAGAASAEEIHRVFTIVLQSRFAAVLSTDEWISVLRSGATPERDTIVGSNRRARFQMQLEHA